MINNEIRRKTRCMQKVNFIQTTTTWTKLCYSVFEVKEREREEKSQDEG